MGSMELLKLENTDDRLKSLYSHRVGKGSIRP